MLPTGDLVAVLLDFQQAFPTADPPEDRVARRGEPARPRRYGGARRLRASAHRVGSPAVRPLPEPRAHPRRRAHAPLGVGGDDRRGAVPRATGAHRPVDAHGGAGFRVLADQTWRIGDLGAKHALLLAGVGWGGMPAAMVQADLQAGRLVELRLPDWSGVTATMHLVHAAAAPPGPAGRWLMRRFEE